LGRVFYGRRSGWIFIALAVICAILAAAIWGIGCLPWDWRRCLNDGEQHSQSQELHIPPRYHDNVWKTGGAQ
jgi:hypothetical protein